MVWYGMVYWDLSAIPKRPQLVATQTQQKGHSKLTPYKIRNRSVFSRSRQAAYTAGKVPGEWRQTIPTPTPQKEDGVQLYPMPGMGHENQYRGIERLISDLPSGVGTPSVTVSIPQLLMATTRPHRGCKRQSKRKKL